jgi:hypothetical protein
LSNHRRERRETFTPPPRNARRTENASYNLTKMQTRLRGDLQLNGVCRDASGSRVERMGVEEESGQREVKERGGNGSDERGDIERQDAVTKSAAKIDVRRYRPFSESKTCDLLVDRVGLTSCLYIGILVLAAFLGSTLYLAIHPPRALAVMTVSFSIMILLHPVSNCISLTQPIFLME